MSGDMGKWGERAKVAKEIFFDKNTAKYDYQVIFEDNQGPFSKSVTSLNKLIYRDNLDIVISVLSNMGFAMAPVIKEKDLL